MGTRIEELQISLRMIWECADEYVNPNSELRSDLEYAKPLLDKTMDLLEACRLLVDLAEAWRHNIIASMGVKWEQDPPAIAKGKAVIEALGFNPLRPHDQN